MRKAGGLLLIAVLATGLGLLVADRPAQACSCAEPSWTFDLSSVTGEVGAPSHLANWPARVTMSGYPGTVTLNSEGYAGDRLDYIRGSTR